MLSLGKFMSSVGFGGTVFYLMPSPNVEVSIFHSRLDSTTYTLQGVSKKVYIRNTNQHYL